MNRPGTSVAANRQLVLSLTGAMLSREAVDIITAAASVPRRTSRTLPIANAIAKKPIPAPVQLGYVFQHSRTAGDKKEWPPPSNYEVPR